MAFSLTAGISRLRGTLRSLHTSLETASRFHGWFILHSGYGDRKGESVSKRISLVSNLATVSGATRIKSSFIGTAQTSHLYSCTTRQVQSSFHDLGEEIVPYDGIPFVILGRYDRKCNRKEKQETQEQDNPNLRKSTKKQDCQAKIILKEVICFPDFKISADTEKLRRTMSETLRFQLKRGIPVRQA